MTPLATRFMKELSKPQRKQRIYYLGSERIKTELRKEVHCFEVTAIWPAALQLVTDMGIIDDAGAFLADNKGIDGRLAFLPAPRTWLEMLQPDRSREGFLLLENGEKGAQESATVLAVNNANGYLASHHVGILELNNPKPKTTIMDNEPGGWSNEQIQYCLYGLLALINTPQMIGRKTHAPNRALERRLMRAFGHQGLYPLQAWNEILLEVGPPKDASGEPTTEARLTGQKALHFCRAHLRFRLGRLEFVRAHWRGDASIGIKRSRYRVVPSEAANGTP